MTPTDALRDQLRNMLDERIPFGGTDADTRFSNGEIDELLAGFDDINAAAAEGWDRKAARAMSERGGLQETQVGSERLKFVSIESYRDHCRAMAEHYRGRVPGSGSRLFAFEPPDVLLTGDSSGTV